MFLHNGGEVFLIKDYEKMTLQKIMMCRDKSFNKYWDIPF